MSILMIVSGDSGRFSDDGVDRFSEITAADGRPVAVIAYRDAAIGDETQPASPGRSPAGYGVQSVLTGFRDPLLADRLSREFGVPVYVAVSVAADVDGRLFDAFDSVPGVAVFRCDLPDDHADAVACAALVDFVDRLSAEYRSYADGLRHVPSAAATADSGAYASIMDSYGDGARAVETVLDAVLEQLCGAESDPSATALDHRWMTTVIEDGDSAAEEATRLLRLAACSTADAADYARRVTRVAASFASSFWRDFAGPPPTDADRVLAAGLIENLRAAAETTGTVASGTLAELSAEQFAVCLNARFIDAQRWRSCSADDGTELFRPEIRERLERFTGANHLKELMATGDAGDDGAFGRSHVELLGPHVLPQRLADHASRHHGLRVRYFALTDTLTFRFTDGERGQLVEEHHEHRFTGPESFKEFHDELFHDLERSIL